MIDLYSIFLKEERSLLRENLGREMKHARRVLRANGIDDETAKKLVEQWETKPCFRKSNGKYLKGYARMYANNEINDRNTLEIEKVIELINSKYNDAFTTGLESVSDGHVWTANELISKFGQEVKQELQSSIENGQNKGITKSSDYDFVRIPNFEDASKYAPYTSWCITHGAENYNNYTNYGEGIFIFCLKHGFESVPEEKGEGCPMDEYGKSMIAISINQDGSLHTCTCRWNHTNGGGDQMMTEHEIEEFFGVNFYETFYPRTEDEPFENYDEGYFEKLCFEDAVVVSSLYGEYIYLMQSPADCAVRGGMASEDKPVYGLFYDTQFVSDIEYTKDALDIEFDYGCLLHQYQSKLYDFYLFNQYDFAHIKNIYTWEENEDKQILFGSYLNNNEYILFIVSINDEDIWDGTDKYGRKAVIPNGTQFVFLERFTEEMAVDEYYIATGNEETGYTIVEGYNGKILCVNAHINLNGANDIQEYVPQYDDNTETYYIETINGTKIDIEDGSIISMNGVNLDKGQSIRVYQTFGDGYKLCTIEKRNELNDRYDVKVNIYHHGKWLLPQGEYTLADVRGMKLYTPYLFSIRKNHGREWNFLSLEKDALLWNVWADKVYWHGEQKWGKASFGNKQTIFFDETGKIFFPLIALESQISPYNLYVAVFENDREHAYLIDTEGFPKILNRQRPFNLEIGRGKTFFSSRDIHGRDDNGIPIGYDFNSKKIIELQTEQIKEKFHKILDDIKKR